MVEAEKIDVEEEPCFDDPPGYRDDIPDDELIGDVQHQMPTLDEYDECCILVFGLPNVGAERAGKLTSVLKKIFDNINAENKLKVPVDDQGATRGVCFVEWPSKQMAEYACSVLDGYKLDKNHTFQAILFSNMNQFTKPDENWTEPTPEKYVDLGDLWSWLQHPRCRDQFAIHYENHGEPCVSVLLNMKNHEPEVVCQKEGWTDSFFKWSPHGTYMATLHKQGVLLWAGEKMERYRRFAHKNAQLVDFSPLENYLVTYAPSEARWGEDTDCLRVWNVFTAEQLKGFSLYSLTNRNEIRCWPFFSWSHDEKYFACMKTPEKDKLEKEKKVNGVAVYETATMELLNRKYIHLENLRQFSWNPTKNVLAYYSECEDDMPAEFGLLQIPSGVKLRTARIYNVSEAYMYWQASGLRLGVHSVRYQKKTATKEQGVKYVGGLSSHLEIFDMTEKDVSMMNLPLKEPLITMGWEPYGDKLCVLSGNTAKCLPLVYKCEKDKHQPTLMSKLDPVPQLNTVEWAPAGGWLAVQAAMSTGGNIVFIDASGTEAKRTNVAEHPGFNKAYWDPTGRYFVSTCTVGGRVGADLGFRLYTFQGRELVRKNLDRLMQFKWRPRPPVKLSEQKMKEIRKNLKTTSAKFDREDNEEKVKASQEVIDKRRKIMAAFDQTRIKNLEMIKAAKAQRISLRGGVDTDNRDKENEDLVEEHITVALSTQKTRTTSEAEDEAATNTAVDE